jgi:macroglobulin-like protein
LPYLNVRVVDEDDTPVSGARVMIVIYCDTSPNNLTDHTDNDGIAQFEFDSGISADIWINGILELLQVGLDDQVTVPI